MPNLPLTAIDGARVWFALRPWQPFNDPSPIGWIITVAYAAGSLACYFAFVREREILRQSGGAYRPKLWLAFSVALALFALNKQLDLQILVTNLGRRVFFVLGMYARRRVFQAVFVAAIALVGVAMAIGVAIYARRAGLRYLLPLLGLAYLICFVVIRAASFHYVDELLGMPLTYIKLNAALELLGVLFIGGSAFHRAIALGLFDKR